MGSFIFLQTYLFTIVSVFFGFSSGTLSESPVPCRRGNGNSGQCEYEAVTTTSGRYIGHCSPQHDNIIEYLGISYAQPPTGNLRFAAPVAFTSKDVFEASTQPDDCPYVARAWGSVPGEYWSHAPRIMAQESADGYNSMSEDCLRLNIWAPSKKSAPKAVMVWLYGGGFERGSVNSPDYDGANLAANEDVIVVSFNFRVTIFGFSPAADTNVALRDMRLALEWVRNNIEAFGGDTSRISLFGQSQGAWLISYYAYAYPHDPIASSFIQQSGSAFSSYTQSKSAKEEIWRNVSATVGCDQSSDAAVLECMRAQNISTVLAALTTIPVTTTQLPPFGPTIDDKLIFANYTAKTLSHEFAQKPFLIGSNDNEAGFYVMRYAGNNKFTFNQTEQDNINFGLFSCPTALDTALKAAIFANTSIPVYRYEYFGDWPNLRLYPGSRAYHTAETSMVFGTMEELSGGANTELQVKVSRYMQLAWATFAKDPLRGLQRLGWPAYDPQEKTLIRLGYGEEATASYVAPDGYDAVCKKFGYVL